MVSLPAQRWSLLIVLAISFAVSLEILASRNIYDDELGSFGLIPHSVRQIWTSVNTEDVHPPGAYVVSHWAWEATGSERWMAIVPLVAMYFALAVFAWGFGPYFAQTWPGYLLFLLLLFCHPQMLMWSNSIRWYSYWTSIGLLLLTATALRRRETTVERGALLRSSLLPGIAEGAVLALMFYFNYLTLLYAVALCAMILLLWGWRHKKAGLIEALAAVGMLVVLTIPQWSPMMTVHIPNSANQRFSMSVSGARLAHGLLVSEAILPWRAAAIVFFLLVVVPLGVWGLRLAFQSRPLLRKFWLEGLRQAPVLAVVVFGAVIAAAAVASGTGFKARSFLILTPWVAVLAAGVFNQIRWPVVRIALLGIAMFWAAAGAANLLTRQGTAKTGLNDHPDEVVDLVLRQAHDKSAIIFCHDPVVTYCLNRAVLREQQPWSVCSYYTDYIHDRPAGFIDQKDPALVFVVHSYGGSLLEDLDGWDQLTSVLKAAEQGLENPSEARLSHDPDAAMKRRIPGMGVKGAELPEDRFIVVWGKTKPGIGWTAIADEMRNLRRGGRKNADTTAVPAK